MASRWLVVIFLYVAVLYVPGRYAIEAVTATRDAVEYGSLQCWVCNTPDRPGNCSKSWKENGCWTCDKRRTSYKVRYGRGDHQEETVVYRLCSLNKDKRKDTGCSRDYFPRGYYEICRCSTDMCNSVKSQFKSLTLHQLLMTSFGVFCLHIFSMFNRFRL